MMNENSLEKERELIFQEGLVCMRFINEKGMHFSAVRAKIFVR